MKIAIFGYGFIAKNLVSSLSKTKNEIFVIAKKKIKFQEKNINSIGIDILENTFDSALLSNFDATIYLVNIGTPGNNQEKNIQAELDLFDKFLKIGIEASVKKQILISSASVYGDKAETPFRETDELNPLSDYAKSRVNMEELIESRAKEYMFDYKILRLSNPYGPHQKKQGVINRILRTLVNQETLQIDNAGQSVRDFIYIDDLVQMIENITLFHSHHNIYNLSYGKGYLIKEIIDIIAQRLPQVERFIEIQSVNIYSSHSILSNDLYVREFPNPSFTRIDDGISYTYEWLMNNLED